MRVFYDLETSGLDTKHQILTACFILTNDIFEIDKVLNFRVALNPLEIPAESAISVNAVDITQHMLHHKNKFPDLLTEEQFALKVNALLTKYLNKDSALIGYNSNKFDIKHLRKVLIKWGYNPYYSYNRFPMVDLYNHIKFLKLAKPKEFVGIENLKLGSVFKQLIKKEPTHLHEAEADVHHCVDISKFLLKEFDWDIVAENHKVNNLASLELVPGDIIMIANPYEQEVTFDKCIVHEITPSYTLLEKTILRNPEENKFVNVHKNDFRIGKKVGHEELKSPMTVDKYFASFEGNKGVESFVYHIKFDDFECLEEIRSEPGLGYLIDSNTTPLGELINSQIFTRERPIKHTEEGLVVDPLTEEEQAFIIRHFSQYGLGEDDVFLGEKNEDKVQLLREYKTAYKELYESLK